MTHRESGVEVYGKVAHPWRVFERIHDRLQRDINERNRTNDRSLGSLRKSYGLGRDG